MLLLIVDMQKGLFTKETPRYDTPGVIQRINRLIERFRVKDFPIIFVQHEGPENDPLEPGTLGWEILDELDRTPGDLVIGKKACDAFLNTPLLETIQRTGETHILITGCATDFCVDTTIKSAASKDLTVTVAKDAHTTANRPHLDAKTIIAHHNWSWENLILDQAAVRVADTLTLENELKKEKR